MKRKLVLCLLLTAVTLATFWPVSRAEFLNYDDNEYVSDNPHIVRGLTLDDVRWAFGASYAGNWHPLTWVSHMIDVQLFGLQQPGWHHLVNLLLHTVNAVLLLLLLQRLTNALWPSAFVAALFALHPLHVESVAWVAERKDVLSTFFFFLTLLAYERYARASNRRSADMLSAAKSDGRAGLEVDQKTLPFGACCGQHVRAPAQRGGRPRPQPTASASPQPSLRSIGYALALVFFALGLMSKPMLVTTPFVLLLLDCWPLGRLATSRNTLSETLSGAKGFPTKWPTKFSSLNVFNRSNLPLLLEKLPFFALSAGASVVTFLVQRHAGAVAQALPLAARVENAIVSYFRYIRKTFWPVDLCVSYPHPTYWPAATVVFCAFVLAGVSFLAIWMQRRRPWLLVGWLWYLGMLVPVIGLVQVGEQSMADRYTYVPMIGLSLMVVWWMTELHFRLWSAPAERSGDGALAGGTLVSAGQSGVALRLTPHSKWLVPGAGVAALVGCVVLTSRQVGFWMDSEVLFRRAVAVSPNKAASQGGLARALADKGRLEEAAPYFREALRLNPRDTVAYVGLADLEARHNRLDEAYRLLQQAIQLAPNDTYAHNNFGMVLARQGKLIEATNQFQLAIQADPDNAEAHANLGTALLMPQVGGQTDAAILQFQQAIWLKPSYAKAHKNLGVAYARKGLLDPAIAEFQTALKVKPDFAEAADYLRQAQAEKSAKQRN